MDKSATEVDLETVVNMAIRLALDVLNGNVTPETVALAEKIAFTDADFVLYLAGANLENLEEVTALAREELDKLARVGPFSFEVES